MDLFALIVAYYGDIMQVALAAISATLMVVSLNAYRRKSEGRYLILAVAFISLCAFSVTTVIMELSTDVGPATTQLISLYLIPAFELLMAVSFLAALLWSPKHKHHLRIVFPVAIVILVLVVLTAIASDPRMGAGSQSALPGGCSRPVSGFLIVASALGYNDSVLHGAPAKSWPVLNAQAGSNVTITICNTSQWPVGFQVAHYLQENVESILPGKALTVSFVADQKGGFFIYCGILCPIHFFLQGGELDVR